MESIWFIWHVLYMVGWRLNIRVPQSFCNFFHRGGYTIATANGLRWPARFYCYHLPNLLTVLRNASVHRCLILTIRNIPASLTSHSTRQRMLERVLNLSWLRFQPSEYGRKMIRAAIIIRWTRCENLSFCVSLSKLQQHSEAIQNTSVTGLIISDF